MIGVALKGLAGRKLRAALTALAIVLGVAMMSGTFILTDTINGAFNSIFENGSDRATIEWRFDRRGEKQIPYAIIVRFHTAQDGRKGDVLVVSKVSPTETCHVAYIDALANQDAITLARFVADNQAKTFDCREEPRPEGATGRSPM